MEFNIHIAITVYSITAVIVGVMTLMLPIETKGRAMTVCLLVIYSHIYIGLYLKHRQICYMILLRLLLIVIKLTG